MYRWAAKCRPFRSACLPGSGKPLPSVSHHVCCFPLAQLAAAPGAPWTTAACLGTFGLYALYAMLHSCLPFKHRSAFPICLSLLTMVRQALLVPACRLSTLGLCRLPAISDSACFHQADPSSSAAPALDVTAVVCVLCQILELYKCRLEWARLSNRRCTSSRLRSRPNSSSTPLVRL